MFVDDEKIHDVYFIITFNSSRLVDAEPLSVPMLEYC